MFFPSSPRYERIPNAAVHRRYLITDDVYISPIRHVKCRVRVLAARATPSRCSGAEYCGLDVFVAHGMATTPWYWRERLAGRFAGAFITDESIVDRHADMHLREGFLPACLTLGDSVYRDCTHLHIVTAHAPGWHADMPQPHQLFDLDMTFVDVFAMPPAGDTSVRLTSGSAEFGTLDCPFVIQTAHLSGLKSFDLKERKT